MAFRGGPGAEEPWRDDGIWVCPWAPFHPPNSFQEQFNMQSKIHHETCRNEGIRKSRMQITKIRKIKAVICSHYNRGTRRRIEGIFRSLVAPLRGAGGFSLCSDVCSLVIFTKRFLSPAYSTAQGCKDNWKDCSRIMKIVKFFECYWDSTTGHF